MKFIMKIKRERYESKQYKLRKQSEASDKPQLTKAIESDRLKTSY